MRKIIQEKSWGIAIEGKNITQYGIKENKLCSAYFIRPYQVDELPSVRSVPAHKKINNYLRSLLFSSEICPLLKNETVDQQILKHMSASGNLTPKHLLLTLLTVLVWGTNFIAIYIGLKDFPPFLLCAIRFGLAAFPWVFIFPRPKVPLKLIVGFGFFNFALQFGLLFSGIYLGLSPGLSSLVLQTQIFFSFGLAFLIFGEKPNIIKIVGSLISFIGIAIVAAHIHGGTTFIGLTLTLLAALAWASGNIITKKIDAQSPLSLVIWGNLVAFPFMAIASLLVEGTSLAASSFQNMSWAGIGAVLYIVYLSTHLGYGIWGFLLKTYPTSVVVPFTLLIPVFAFMSSAIFLGESMPFWKILASLFIMGGLVFNLLEKQIWKLFGIVKSVR